MKGDTTMTKTQAKKESLINFIRWKMEQGGDSLYEIHDTITKLKKMSYKAVHEYAIYHDFIDY
jgi:hypothetical protein